MAAEQALHVVRRTRLKVMSVARDPCILLSRGSIQEVPFSNYGVKDIFLSFIQTNSL